MKIYLSKSILFACLLTLANPILSWTQEHAAEQPHPSENNEISTSHEGQPQHAEKAAGHEEEEKYTDLVMEHISDANEFHVIGDIHIPLPCILLADGKWSVFMSSDFEHGHKVVDGYVLDKGVVRRLADAGARTSLEHIERTGKVGEGDEQKLMAYAHGQSYELEKASTLFKSTSWKDFSITKNVFTMLIALLIFFLIMTAVKRGYQKNVGKAPTGIQSFFEPVIVFLRDDVVKPNIGPKWERYFPFIASLFFFILINNLLGLIPFFPGGSNVTGNVGMTMVLAVFAFIVVNVSGNKNYWEHIVWMPGVPAAIKLILTPIEILGIFIKPFTLFIRLFANITAGHIVILSLIGLIFLFGGNGASVGGSMGGALVAVPFVFAMNFLELFVAFLQAFIFALLTSIYIGGAVEEHHHVEHH